MDLDGWCPTEMIEDACVSFVWSTCMYFKSHQGSGGGPNPLYWLREYISRDEVIDIAKENNWCVAWVLPPLSCPSWPPGLSFQLLTPLLIVLVTCLKRFPFLLANESHDLFKPQGNLWKNRPIGHSTCDLNPLRPTGGAGLWSPSPGA